MSKIWDAMKQAERERELLHVVSDDEEYRPLSTKQLAAVAALSETGSLSEACRRSGVGDRTMMRWLASAQFAAAYRKATHGRYADALSSLRAASVEAVEALRRALQSESEEIRVQAAVAILNLAGKSELSEVIGRAARRRLPSASSKKAG
jgi:transposase-like protein